MNPDMLPENTKHKIDNQCKYETMFKSPEDLKTFGLFFVQTCYKQNKCIIDTENMELNITYTPEQQSKMSNPVPWELKTSRLSDMVSRECYKRIFQEEVTTLEFITVMGCISDNVKVLGKKFHKEEVGFITVVMDIISIIFMYYMFGKIN